MRKNIRGIVEIVILLPVLVIGILVVIYSVFLNKNSTVFTQEKDVDKSDKVVNDPLAPSPFPFQELTIPYLREKTFTSSLEKMQKVSENLDYTSYVTSYNSDGFTVYGLLTIPNASPSTKARDSSKYPAIVFVHGYIPPEEYQTRVNYNSYVDYLAKNGFVVFKIDLRGHGNSEGEPGGAYYSSDYVIDTLNAVAALKAADFVNPRAIGLWGHSMAGNVVFRSFVAKGDIPAVVIWAGAGYTYKDLQEYRLEDSSYKPPPPDSERARKRQKLRDLYGDFKSEHWFWEQIVPTNYLENVVGAIQLNHAVNDNVVSIEYSRNLMKVLDSTNILHELNEYETGGHNLTGETFSEAMQKTIEFFENNLSK